jgi:predicted  nucleic acid-binding Zn-ribbon protein
MRDAEMCEQCVELDERIDHYERLARMITDQRALDEIKRRIDLAKAKKVELHPELDR